MELKRTDHQISDNFRFAPYVNKEIAIMAYGDFMEWVYDISDESNVFFGYYCDGEPFCSGMFGEMTYRQFLNH